MNSATAIIEALNARSAPPGRLRQAALTSWGLWMSRMAERPGRVHGAPAQELVDQLAARPLAAPPPRSGALGRWGAFASLWRQQWHPASRDERVWRWAAGGTSFVWHVVLILLILWVTALHFLPPPPATEGEAVQVEFIGVGMPDEQGGGEAPSPGDLSASSPGSPSQAAAADAAPAAASPEGAAVEAPSPPVPDVVATVPEVASRDVPEPQPAPQPLTVTAPVSPEAPVFELPPTTPPTPVLAQPELARAPPVREVAVPEPVRAPPVDVAPARVALEPLATPAPAVARREVPTPVRLPALRAPVSAPPAPDVAATAPQPATRSVPAPRAAAPASTASATAQAPAAASDRPAGAPRPATGSRASGPAAPTPNPGVGVGPRPSPAPGSWATPRRADDWGDSDRNRPGRGDGLRDATGAPRIGAAPGSAAPGRPPGTVTEEIADLDRAGTWLKRQPYPYEPTRFDRFWRPNETLLQEWVRRGIKQVSIPIPGTSKRIVCGISILQLGGGCWAVDPNLNEQPATARPPPDIPFKPGLQEDPGATPPRGTPPGG